MEMNRTELLPGVWLNHLRSDRFKTACLSISLLTQLTRETASMNALIPFVLRRGCARYGDAEAISARLKELGGTVIEPAVRQVGEIQCLGFVAEIPETEKEDRLRPVCELLGELLLNPATRGGLLLPQTVDSEREAMLEAMRACAEDPAGYAVMRCLEEMCCFEDFAAGRFGSEEETRNIRYQKLSKHYRSLLPVCPIEIIYCGRADRKRLAAILRDTLATLPRGEIDYELGTEIRMNALEDQPREVTEPAESGAGRLVIGFRLGDCMEDPDLAAVCCWPPRRSAPMGKRPHRRRSSKSSRPCAGANSGTMRCSRPAPQRPPPFARRRMTWTSWRASGSRRSSAAWTSARQSWPSSART